MKICIIFPAYPPGYQADGIGDYTRILVRRLRERGHDVYVVVSGRYTGNDENVIRAGDSRWNAPELLKVFRKVREARFDVVHMQYTPVTYGFGIVFKLLPLLLRLSAPDIFFVTTFHTLVGGKWTSRINALLLSMFSHRIISTNEEITLLFNKWLCMFKGKLSQIPVGANISPAETDIQRTRGQMAKDYGIGRDAVVLSNFGFFYPGKGIEELIMALNKLRAADRYYLLLIGALRDEDAEYRRYLQGIIRTCGLEKDVVWTGELKAERVSELLKASDMYVVPYSDGISIRRGSLMAGIVNGVPIISTFPRVEMPYFKNGENVVLVERGNHDQLAAAIERLTKDKDLRGRLSGNVAALAKGFDWDRIADRTLEVYSSGGGRNRDRGKTCP